MKVLQRGYAEGELALAADGASAQLREPIDIDGRGYQLPACESLQFSPTGRFLVAASARHRQLVAIVDRHQGRLLSIPSHLQSDSVQAFDADQRLLVTNHFGVSVYSLPDFALELHLQPHGREIDAQREAMREAPPCCRVALPALHVRSTASADGHYLTSDYEGLQAQRGSARRLVWEKENVVWLSWVGEKLLLCRANGWELAGGEVCPKMSVEANKRGGGGIADQERSPHVG